MGFVVPDHRLLPSVRYARINRMSKRITVSSDICNGKPVIHGTRITVQTVLEFLAAGDSIEDVLEEYPALKREDVHACLDYASKLMANHYSLVPAT
jgi:uncharacterized protein (DUF433 family)